jgi:hypothetical protein
MDERIASQEDSRSSGSGQAVLKETKALQSPWENSSLTGDFCFRNGPAGLSPTSI